MAQEITTTGNNAVVDAAVPARVGALYGSIGRDDRRRCDTLPAPIDYATRKLISEYRVMLHSKLRPISEATAERDKAGTAIGVFLQGYINIRVADPRATTRAYLAMLMDQPLFAIMQAIDDFKNGRVFDIGEDGQKIPFKIDRAPDAPRLLDQVKKCAAALQEERFKCQRLLSITTYAEPPISNEQRERVGKMLRELADGMTSRSKELRKIDMEKTREQADEARERARRIIEDAQNGRITADQASQDRAAAEANPG